MSGKIRVLIVDDSALVRLRLSELLSSDPAIEVVGTAADPYVAREKILALRPDVITLDVEMPRMDGLSFLKILMRKRPTPVVMVSSLTEQGCAAALEAVALGAVDFVTKPKIGIADGIAALRTEIVEKVKAASLARMPAVGAQTAAMAMPSSRLVSITRTTDQVIAIGGSTGSTEAVAAILSALPRESPGIVIAIHMPGSFTGPYAQRCSRTSALEVREAAHGDRVANGLALVAPGGMHLRVVRDGAAFRVALSDEAPVRHHRPSVDVMFHSVAEAARRNAVGVILTGMGSDGADGLLAMRRAGAKTIAQDEASCVVFGMPKEAIARGAADIVKPLNGIPAAMLES